MNHKHHLGTVPILLPTRDFPLKPSRYKGRLDMSNSSERRKIPTCPYSQFFQTKVSSSLTNLYKLSCDGPPCLALAYSMAAASRRALTASRSNPSSLCTTREASTFILTQHHGNTISPSKSTRRYQAACISRHANETNRNFISTQIVSKSKLSSIIFALLDC